MQPSPPPPPFRCECGLVPNQVAYGTRRTFARFGRNDAPGRPGEKATPTRCSKRLIVWLSADCERPSLPAARVRLGVSLDSAPDRWGRVLMQRREALLAREGKRAERRLTELDYVLGVYDGHRMGGLRYRIDNGPFLDDNAELASPPWTSLRDLEHASLELERAGADRDRRYGAWLRMLIAPGRSLGGARPKSQRRRPQGHLWLAKFPSAGDQDDVGGWEGVVHALASRAGVDTAEAKRQKVGSRHHTFLTKRFDRAEGGGRIHFASAMTLLDRRDGEEGGAISTSRSCLAGRERSPHTISSSCGDGSCSSCAFRTSTITCATMASCSRAMVGRSRRPTT